MNFLKHGMPIAFALVFAGCDQYQNVQERLSKLEEQGTNFARLENEIAELQKSLTQARDDLFELRFKVDAFKSTSFDPAEGKGYGRVDTGSGTFLVSITNVQPYLDGVRVTLQIGNIQSATYPSFSIEAKYGRRFPRYKKEQPIEERRKALAEYEQSMRQKTTKFTETLRPATWNRVSVVLPDIKPADFGFLEVALNVDTVRLSSSQ